MSRLRSFVLCACLRSTKVRTRAKDADEFAALDVIVLAAKELVESSFVFGVVGLMELYLLHPEKHRQLYGCVNITVEDVPLEERQHIPEGVVFIALAAFYYFLYIPCIPSIYRHMNNPCYKFLFFISLVDCTSLWFVGFLHGYFAITGVVYCSHPTLIYFLGCYAWLFWILETSGQLFLVTDRCVAMLSSEIENLIFGGRRIYIWFSAAIVWGFCIAFFVRPLLFTGIYFSWSFNPYVGYQEDKDGDYVIAFHLFWEGTFAVAIPLLYIIFALLFYAKSHKLEASKQVSKQQKLMLLQVFIISMLNFVTCSVYVSMMYIVPSKILIHFATFCWLHIHGFPPVIYLAFNPTIQKDAKKMWFSVVRRCKLQTVKRNRNKYNSQNRTF